MIGLAEMLQILTGIHAVVIFCLTETTLGQILNSLSDMFSVTAFSKFVVFLTNPVNVTVSFDLIITGFLFVDLTILDCGQESTLKALFHADGTDAVPLS